jgi:hypothetical protein
MTVHGLEYLLMLCRKTFRAINVVPGDSTKFPCTLTLKSGG